MSIGVATPYPSPLSQQQSWQSHKEITVPFRSDRQGYQFMESQTLAKELAELYDD